MQKKSVFTLPTIVPCVLLLVFFFSFSLASAAPWDEGWHYRKKITIDHTLVQDNFTDFPVLISVTSDADLAANAQPDGDDIIFTDASDTRLDHEIEKPFDSTTGTFVAWVRVPSLSSTADTFIYMYYGNPTSGNQENPGGVWSSSYKGVWHLHDDFLDSTSNGNDSTNNGSTDTVGKIANGQDFDGTTNYINAPDHGLGANSNWTVSFWFYTDSSSENSYHYIISTGSWAGLNTLQVWQPIITGEVAVRLIDSDGDEVDLFGHAGGGNYLDDTWHLAHVVWDASAQHLYLYIDGSLYRDEVNANVDAGSGTTNALTMGARQDHAADRFLLGGLDEIRISSSTKTASWIETEHTNQDEPNSFYTVGSELEENECADDNDCGFCEKCDAGMCISQTDSEDIKGECPDGDCVTGFCGGAGACGFDTPGTSCADDGNGCTGDECDGTGTCTHPFLLSGTACGDPSDTQCTDPDTCDGAGICWDNHASTGTSCDDGMYCNGTDTCSGGTCMHAGDPCSDDGQFCNGTESCDETLENCSNSGDPCTPPEVCDEDNNICATIPPGGWWNSAWLYRQALTIDPANVDTDLTGFPVLIDLTDADVATYAQTSGDDLVFTDYNGLQLSHEIELYDTGTGHVIAWVRVPTVSSTEGTVLYLYFGNGLASNQQNPTGTWDGNYVMVQHLDEDSGEHYDSTGYLNNSDLVVVTDQVAAGTINGADEFAGTLTTGDYIRMPDNIDSSLQFDEGSFTAEAWINPRSVPDTTGARIVNNRGTGVGGNYPGWHVKIKDFGGQWSFGDSGIDDAAGNYMPYEGTIRYSYNQWHQVVMVYESDSELRFYVNGAPDGTLTIGDYGSITNSLPTVIGASIVHEGIPGADNKQFFDGIIDEVRLSDTVRSADWISASYSNQNNPGGFYSVGDLEFSTGPPTVSAPEPADGAIDVSTTLTALRFTLTDPDGDPMDYTVTTSPDIGSGSASGVTNGTYSVMVSGLDYETIYQWDISVDDGSGVTDKSYTFTTGKAPAVWWNSAWTYRRTILLDPTDVAEDLNNFPVLIAIDDGSLLSNVQDDADDIAFTDYEGGQLNHEVESYDPSTGALVAWVSVPFLSSTADTDLYMYYGNSEATNQENAPAVWDSSYVMVQHLDETEGPHFDSTGNANDGTAYDLATQDAPGKIDGADEFDASGDLIDVGTNASLGVFGPEQDFSIFLWVKRDATTEVEGFFSSGSSGLNGIYFGSAYNNTDDLKFMSIGQTVEIESTTEAIGDTGWHHVGITADRDGNLTFWVDGISVHSESIAATSAEDWNRTDDTYKIGTDRSETSIMDGIIDEVRVSDMVMGAGWIQTSYTNQSNPGAFYLLGTVESETDSDGDGIPDHLDNCPNYPNGPLRGTCTEVVGTNLIVSTGQFCTDDADCGDSGKFCEKTQADNYPPGGNGIGDACDCEADFDCDSPGLDVDADNITQFLWDFGRSLFFNPCSALRACYGDFNCDGNVDADDVPKLLEDFGRTLYVNKCPACVPAPDDWCVYP